MVEDILQVQGVNSKGFGIIPKMVMQDKRLTVQAKAIYGYFCSYAGAGKTAFPRRDKIIHDLQIGKGCYYKHFALLKDCGYIKVEQEKNKQGFYTRNIYTLVESVPCTENRDTDKTAQNWRETEPCPINRYTEEKHTPPCTDLRDTDLRYTGKRDINKNNSFKNNSFYNHQSVSQDRTDGRSMESLIKSNISYRDLSFTHAEDIELINEFIAIILDVMISKSETVRISGEDKPRELVKCSLMKVSHDNIIHVLGQWKGQEEQIKNKRQYILTMLYNSTMELNAHYTNWVQSDRRYGR